MNRRIYFPTHIFGIAPFQSITYISAHGAQQIGVNTNYSLENIQELGQVSVYQLVEQIPEIEVSVEKVLDGYPLLYHLATQGASDASLIGRSNQRCQLAMSVYGDSQNSASGVPTSQIMCSGMYWQQHSLNFSTDSSFRESMTLVGNDKVYKSSGFDFTPTFTNTDLPLAISGSGGVQKRQDFIFYPILGTGISYPQTLEQSTSLDINGQLNAFLTILPPEVGVSASGTNDRDSSGNFLAHITNIGVSVNVGRDAVLELGRKDPYQRFVTFPVAVTTEISTIATQTDTLQASEQGLDGFGNNLVNRTIRIRVREGTFVDLGTNNKCQSVSFTGGGADGGQVTTTFSFITYNTYTVTHPQDPSHFTYPY